MKNIKSRTLNAMLIRLTWDGAFQRSKIYTKEATDKQKKEFRSYMAEKLSETMTLILKRKRYNDRDHYKMLQQFAKEVQRDKRNILSDEKFRIGSAQKFLNLYWKVSWLLKRNVRMPIHCPFDSIIIGKLGKSVRDIRWTDFKSIREYKKLVKATTDKIGKGKSIAQWELEEYLKYLEK